MEKKIESMMKREKVQGEDGHLTNGYHTSKEHERTRAYEFAEPKGTKLCHGSLESGFLEMMKPKHRNYTLQACFCFSAHGDLREI